MIDLRAKANLTHADSLWLCSAMQVILLDETFRVMGWTAPDAVFHGGSSIRLGLGSQRFSEDLDFMVSARRLGALMAASGEVAERARRRMLAMTPGATVAFKATPEKPGRDRMDTWSLKWSHPMRHGVAQVKGEFYAVPHELLARYQTSTVIPTPVGGMRLTIPVPFPTLLAIWGDKLKAIASRPEFKMRDAYDLGLVSQRFGLSGSPSAGEFFSAISVSAAIYGKTLDDIASGLRARLDDGTMARQDDFVRDMQRWFDGETYLKLSASGSLLDCWMRTEEEMRTALGFLVPHIAPAVCAVTP
jgi:hypothetical protein